MTTNYVKGRRGVSIPGHVLDIITEHRPHLAIIVSNLRQYPSRAQQLEKALADAYLMGETRLTMADTWALSRCCVGKAFTTNTKGGI